jgi:hypothetical protein
MVSSSSFLKQSSTAGPSIALDVFVFARKEIKQQPIVGVAVDEVALPLPADEAEVEALY